MALTDKVKRKITGILEDPESTREEKVERLLTLREDARAYERAATESPMPGEGPGSDLQEIDLYLQDLGYGADLKAADEKNAATL